MSWELFLWWIFIISISYRFTITLRISKKIKLICRWIIDQYPQYKSSHLCLIFVILFPLPLFILFLCSIAPALVQEFPSMLNIRYSIPLAPFHPVFMLHCPSTYKKEWKLIYLNFFFNFASKWIREGTLVL